MRHREFNGVFQHYNLEEEIIIKLIEDSAFGFISPKALDEHQKEVARKMISKSMLLMLSNNGNQILVIA